MTAAEKWQEIQFKMFLHACRKWTLLDYLLFRPFAPVCDPKDWGEYTLLRLKESFEELGVNTGIVNVPTTNNSNIDNEKAVMP